MDIEKKSASYQEKQQTYQIILNEIAQEYGGGDIMDFISEGKSIGSLLVQYEETDWEFMKRLASHFHAGILPDTKFGEPKIYFGLKKESSVEEIQSYSYKIEKNLSNYKRLQAINNGSQTETDAVSFQVSSGRFYKTGLSVKFHGKSLYISKMEAKKIQGEIVFDYWLNTPNGLEKPYLYAENLIGVSIEATVVESVKDKVLVNMVIDENAGEKKSVWEFPYQTMYTAGSEGGWYCMPELGDKVFIHFPDKKEENGIAENSSRSGENKDASTSDPTIKYFRTIHGKEIRFTKKAVIITCNDGVSAMGNQKYKIIVDAGKTIGTRGESLIEVILSDDGGMLSAFPIS